MTRRTVRIPRRGMTNGAGRGRKDDGTCDRFSTGRRNLIGGRATARIGTGGPTKVRGGGPPGRDVGRLDQPLWANLVTGGRSRLARRREGIITGEPGRRRGPTGATEMASLNIIHDRRAVPFGPTAWRHHQWRARTAARGRPAQLKWLYWTDLTTGGRSRLAQRREGIINGEPGRRHEADRRN